MGAVSSVAVHSLSRVLRSFRYCLLPPRAVLIAAAAACCWLCIVATTLLAAAVLLLAYYGSTPLPLLAFASYVCLSVRPFCLCRRALPLAASVAAAYYKCSALVFTGHSDPYKLSSVKYFKRH